VKNIFVGLLVFAGLQCAWSPRAAAQAGPSCSWTFSIWSWEAVPFGAHDCQYTGVEGAVPCQVQTYLCPPAAAPQETCATCAAAAAGRPISLASGNTFIKETDVRLPGLSGGLTLVRTWNSLWPSTQTAVQVGFFGPNWRSNFEERVFLGNDNYLKYARGDGSFWSFGYGSPTGGGVWSIAAPANVSATLTQGTSYWTITFQNGETRHFDNTSGHLTAIIDRNGNTTQLSYDAVGRLATVTDPASRQLSFTYGSGSSLLVIGVTSNFGVSLTYAYDNQGRLSQVTESDLSTLSFQYNNQSLITAVTDSNGIILESHTYDSSGRGLTSSQANGVDAVTISYTN
jgi:YD repeat-containing protein